MSAPTFIPASGLVAAPWRNGLGTSYEITSGPGWTVSIAELERDGPFSHYPGADRIFTPIAGEPPPALAFDGGAFEPCPLLVPKPFPGDIPTRSRIPAPGRAFNVIVDRAAWRPAVRVLHLAAGDPLETPAAAHAVWHCLRGHLTMPGNKMGHDVGPGDSLCYSLGDSLAGPGTSGTAAVESVALLVTIVPA